MNGETLCVILFLLILAGVILCATWALITWPYFRYKIYKKSNKLQWRCEERSNSREKRKNHESDIYECTVAYRILPSELNWFVRVFGDNDWNHPFEDTKKFANENEFKEFVKDWKTYGDWKKWVNKENGILWYEPPIDN